MDILETFSITEITDSNLQTKTTEIINEFIKRKLIYSGQINPDDIVIICSQKGYEDIIKLMMFHSTFTNRCRTMSLIFASKFGHFNIVKLLTSEFFFSNNLYLKLNNRGHSALDTAMFNACHQGHKDIVLYLIKKGAMKWKINPTIVSWVNDDIYNSILPGRILMKSYNIGGGFEKILDDFLKPIYYK